MTNDKQQTAVEWLYNELLNAEPNVLEWNKLLEQAKEMEKEQMIKAYNKSFELRHNPYAIAEKYYNETYGGGEQ